MDLVIVESPAKRGTLGSYLGDGYQVEASVGHVRDLPKKGLGVDVDNGFEPIYETSSDRTDVITKLKAAAKKADRILLAMDPDREGEAIAFHVQEVLTASNKEIGDRFRRITFNQITRAAVLSALENPGTLNMDRVNAQQARRILDRLVGYQVSQVLWFKIRPKLSAGRVQSITVRFVVERERARRAFRSGAFWGIEAHLAPGGGGRPGSDAGDAGSNANDQSLKATLRSVGGTLVAKGSDFDASTGQLEKGKKRVLLTRETAAELVQTLLSSSFNVVAVKERSTSRSPRPPFTTATLQQDASRKLNMGSAAAMRTAQKLYEQGHITYMRTDSVMIAPEAITGIRKSIRARYGDKYVHPSVRRYRTKSSSAQEAHEAIRPAGNSMPTARDLRLSGAEGRLYELIWKRTVASQMSSPRLLMTTVDIAAGEGDQESVFRANGQTIKFDGFYRAYVEGSDDPDAALQNQDKSLPVLANGEDLDCRKLEPTSHETKPPARFTEASLVQKLEQEGIGRPSTYADTMSKIVKRGYVRKERKQLVPTFVAFAVTALLEQHFENLVDRKFTAKMESDLDRIARGEEDWRAYLEGFYHGDQGLRALVENGKEVIDPREASTVVLPELSARVRIGRYSPFLAWNGSGDSATASLPEDLAPADLDEDRAQALREGGNSRALGPHPDLEEIVYAKSGPYGPYLQLGDGSADGKPKRTSIPSELSLETVTLDQAVQLLSLPAELGQHPTEDKPVKMGISRYGPYVNCGKEYRSIKAPDTIWGMTLERAVVLLSQPKRRGSAPLKTVGAHPSDGKPIELYNGRYGPYVKHVRVNASIPKGTDPDAVTVEEAVELLEKRRKAPKKRRGRRRTARSR